MNYRNIIVLCLCQSLAMSAAPMIVFIGPIVGTELAPNPSWSTLPMAIMIVGIASFSIPASLIMKRIGRKQGFIGALCVSIFADLGAIYAIKTENFVLFSIMMFIIGSTLTFIQQYRFAAAESVESQFVSRAVSWVMLGGVVAGFLGPLIGKSGKDLLPFGDFSGSFILLMGIHFATIIVMLGFKNIQIQPTGVNHDGAAPPQQRPLREIISTQKYLLAVSSGAIGYVVMVLIMTATPLSMHTFDGFSLDDTALVIQSHVIAMYLPSLITGYLINKIGIYKIILVGIGFMMACITINVGDHLFWRYWSSLVCLGIGWNFMFIGGTILLTQCYQSTERFKAQAVNDFTIFGVQAMGSLLSGSLFFAFGWENLNLIPIPFLAGLLIALFLYLRIKVVPQPAA